MAIKPIRTWYGGRWYRSKLEADWAATFDRFNWAFTYETTGLDVNGTYYLPDFYLKTSRTWCEVKGDHDERIDKPRELADALKSQRYGFDEWEYTRLHVVVLRPAGPGRTCMWENATHGQDMVIVHCPECHELGWMDYAGVWRCPRHCRNGGENKFWKLPGGDIHWPGELPFSNSAPEQSRRAA